MDSCIHVTQKFILLMLHKAPSESYFTEGLSWKTGLTDYVLSVLLMVLDVRMAQSLR